MEKNSSPQGWRTWLPAVFLVVSIFMAVLFSGQGVLAFFGPSDADVARKRQEFMDNRTKLTLQLAKCQRDKAKASDAYICGGSSIIYKSLASSQDCLLAKDVAQELGISMPSFTLPLTLPESAEPDA